MQIYSGDSQMKNLRAVLRSMGEGLIGSRYIAYRLCLKDIRAEHSKSVVGLLWDFVDPLIYASIFYVLAVSGRLQPGPMNIPVALFIVTGIMLYQTFTDAVTMPLDIIRRSRNLLTHLKLSPEALMLSVLFRVLFNAGFRVVIILATALVLLKDQFPVIGFIKFLIGFPLIVFAGMAIGILLCPFNTIFNDVGRVTRILLTPLRFATPVMYTLDDKPFAVNYIKPFNPLWDILDSLRSIATENVWAYPRGTIVWMCLYLCIFLLGWFIYHLSVPILAERA